ncbi:flavin oxidoreductase [Rhodocytophaga rosea]|uniref:Flavin oxidoreductase n=1 Tax=Rhodocytophaga rosea TaxID=2704465 RepID=A0A6C0GNF5_9BACT|nr:flavin reductase [Rhodocytophaga rosea]QHT69132.1 flavin oxidoreductase [Rhodocytophaga rosea]
MIFTQDDIKSLEQRYRATFINSLAGFKQAVLVGTISTNGHSNLAIFNSILHIGANPAMYGLLFRPDTVKRDTLTNILDSKVYTLNYVPTSDYEKAHQTSAKYETTISEFTAVGFTEQFTQNCKAPFVQEAVVKIGMQLEERIDIKINGTILLIGSLQYIEMADNLVHRDGFVALEKAGVLACTGLDAYYSTQLLGRLSYARPDKWPGII